MYVRMVSCTWRSENNLWGQFSLPHFMWILGVQLRLISLFDKHLYPVSHLVSLFSSEQLKV